MTRWTIINASAGSGKTYRLTELLTERLSADAGDGALLRPSQIIATTFTRAAAAELKDRIRTGLVDNGLLDQAAALPTALIGTVNSVTGRLLTDFAMDAGRSPELQILTEASEKTAFALATDQIIADAEADNRALLTRTGYDRGTEQNGSKAKLDWTATIHRITHYARANNISPAGLTASADDSIASLTEVLDAEAKDTAPVDTRKLLAEKIRTLPDTLRKDAKDGTIRGPATAEKVLGKIDELRDLDQLLRRRNGTLAWYEWFRIMEGKIPTMTGACKPVSDAYAAVVSTRELLSDTALRTDLADLVRLVFTTAASCLTAYADYKDTLGLIDFTDQEQLTLQLLRGDGVPESTTAAVRKTISQRYSILVVDEFQDTSPLQLALFTELAKLVDEVIWVGDPKQSIYAFRGADPALMDDAVDRITDPDDINGSAETLRYSYRSRQAPLDLSNRIVERLFPRSGKQTAREEKTGEVAPLTLSIPEKRAEKYAKDGALVAGETTTWGPASDGKCNKSDWFDRIADNLAALGVEPTLDGTPPTRAILTRTNGHADEIRTALREHGISCTGAGVPLNTTREGQLTAAALAVLTDSSNTQALIELITFLPDHAAHRSWFTDLTGATDMAARRELFELWAQDPVLAPLSALRGGLSTLGVPELVTAVVDALDLRGRTASSTDPVGRTGTVLGILRAAEDYTTDRDSAGQPATAGGFLTYLCDEGTLSTPTAEPGAVEVLTVHRAKGLGWDSVIVALSDKPSEGKEQFTPAGVWVESTGSLNMTDPLAGRTICFWPETLLTHSGTKQVLAATTVQQEQRQAELKEERRLLYVALTRSKFRTVLAPKTDVSQWKAFKTTDGSGKKKTTIEALADFAVTPEELATLMKDSAPLPTVELPEPVVTVPPARVLDTARGQVPPSDAPSLPATFAPSGAVATKELAAAAVVREFADLGPALVDRGGQGWDRVGDCVHSYLAAPLAALDSGMKLQVAERLITSWKVGGTVTAAQVVECGERWIRFLDETLHVTDVASEVPFTWTNADHQRAEGWLDQLLTTSAGRIIVDHKTYPGADPVGHVRERYLGQMDVYRRALTEIIDEAPAQILIHLPLLGTVLEVVLP